MKKITLYYNIIILSAVAVFSTSCSEDDDSILSKTNHADFSFLIDEEDPFTVHFTNESEQHNASYWRFGDGSDFSTEDSPSYTYPNGGLFEVILAVQGDGTGGEIRKTVEIIDPALQGERIEDGNFQNPNVWNVGLAGDDYALSTVEFTEEGINISNEGEAALTNVVVWQEIQIEAGKQYQFSADVKGGGFNAAWLEFHFSNVKPEGDDYAENNLWSINAWGGCGMEPFEGNILDISCAGDGSSDGIFTFEKGGTAYFVMKSGSWEGTLGPDGVTISNVSIMPVDDIE